MAIPVDGAERSGITVKGIVLKVPAPFKEGHVLRPNEAAVLNQTYAENLRNNFSNTVAKAIEEAGGADKVKVKDLQKQLDSYVTEYDFGVRRAGTITADPVEREALKLAKEKVKEALKAKGIKLKDFPTDKLNALAEEAVGKYPEFTTQAQAIVEAKKSVGLESLELA